MIVFRIQHEAMNTAPNTRHIDHELNIYVHSYIYRLEAEVHMFASLD